MALIETATLFPLIILAVVSVKVSTTTSAADVHGLTAAGSSEPGHKGSDEDQYRTTLPKKKKVITDIHRDPFDVSSGIPKWVDEWIAPMDVRTVFPYYVTGYDMDGSPVYVLEYGNWKFTEALNSGTGGREYRKELINKYLDQAVYRMLRDGLARDSQGIVWILDWNGFNVANFGDPMAVEFALRQIATLAQLDKVLNYAFLVNTNFVAENFVRLIRPFLGNILEKCEVFGTQKAKWQPQLLRKIFPTQLPPWYGGVENWRPIWLGGVSNNTTKLSWAD